MLSEAKHLCAHRARPFASLRVTIEEAARLCARYGYDLASELLTLRTRIGNDGEKIVYVDTITHPLPGDQKVSPMAHSASFAPTLAYRL
jgi:hypothetical protein